jgi:hypothetical protein
MICDKTTLIFLFVLQLAHALLYKEIQIRHSLTPPGQVHMTYLGFALMCICMGSDFFQKKLLWTRKGGNDVIKVFTSPAMLAACNDPTLRINLDDAEVAQFAPVLPIDAVDQRVFTVGSQMAIRKALLECTTLPAVLTELIAGYTTAPTNINLRALWETVSAVNTVEAAKHLKRVMYWNLQYWMVDWNQVRCCLFVCYFLHPVIDQPTASSPALSPIYDTEDPWHQTHTRARGPQQWRCEVCQVRRRRRLVKV